MASWSGFWGDDATVTNSYTSLRNKAPNRYHLSKLFRKRGMRKLGEGLVTIIGDSTPASSASVTISQVQAVADVGQNNLGGVRTIESKELMNKLNAVPTDTGANTARVVATADVTDINLALFGGGNSDSAPSSYATDASGNGGGGKIQA